MLKVLRNFYFIFHTKVIVDDKCAEGHDNFYCNIKAISNVIRTAHMNFTENTVYRLSSVPERANFVYHGTFIIYPDEFIIFGHFYGNKRNDVKNVSFKLNNVNFYATKILLCPAERVMFLTGF